jgi:dipeptidase D
MGELSQLDPQQVWKHFENLGATPRPSFHEEAAAMHVVKEAERMGYASPRDETGNVVVEVPAISGVEDRAIVVLQDHLDMVPVAESGKEHDFTQDPIQAYIDGDYVRARGTTMGADSGIGCTFL